MIVDSNLAMRSCLEMNFKNVGELEMPEQIMSVEQLRELLASRLVTVTFKKVNGDIREMVCTTNSNLIPTERSVTEAVEPRKVSENTIRVWEPLVQGWRSFKAENVIEVR